MLINLVIVKGQQKAGVAVENNMETHNLMPKNDGFPFFSRDWQHIDCKAQSCMRNINGSCAVPSLAIIDGDGRCRGFKVNMTKGVKDAQAYSD
jgi:hypothetical protein